MKRTKVLSLLLALALVISAMAPALASEVPSTDEAISYVQDKGWMTGTDKGFEPEKTVDRATMYEMLWKVEGKPTVDEPASFADVEGKWFATSSAWAEDVSLTTGTGKGYEGERVITKAEAVTILYRYVKDYKGLDVSVGEDTNILSYEDAAEMSEKAAWAVPAMQWACGTGVACIGDGTSLEYGKEINRVSLAQMITVMGAVMDAQTAYVEETVSYENDGRTVPAVVTMPKGAEGKVPAVVIAHGHGGSKDENVGFIGVARALAKAGFASIRMDFPGCGDSTESFQKNTMTNMISDVLAGEAYLVKNYAVDADKLGILGYSMGGRIASEIVGSKDNPFKAVVLLSAADGDQTGELAVNLFGSKEDYDKLKATANKDGYAVFTTVYGQVQELSKEWFADMEAGKPLESLAKFDGPVLVLHGDKDTMITDQMNKDNLAACKNGVEIIVPEADHGYGFYSDQPAVTKAVEGSIAEFFGEKLMGKVSGFGSRVSTEKVVSIEVAAQDEIPAHTVPGTLCAPADTAGKKLPAVVMLHGTGSNRDEAGMGYAMGAPIMAEAGIVTLRIDFMGNGDSKANYTDYNYTSANIDAKAAADYLAGLDYVDATKIAVMGWSQGGTNALLAAAAYPETFSAVVTWAGALDLTTMFEDFAAATAAANDGGYEMTFEWRDSLMVGARWFKEVAETDVLAAVKGLKAPVLAIYGTLDDTVDPACAGKIAEAVANGKTYAVEGADHTYNVFAEGDAGYPALFETVKAGIDFLLDVYK